MDFINPSSTELLPVRTMFPSLTSVHLLWSSLYRYSKRAKELLASLELKPPPKIIEVDLRGKILYCTIPPPSNPILLLEDDQAIKKFLTRLTHHSTFPNILIKGKSLGGSDDLANLHSNNKLNPLLLKAGVKPQKS